MHKAYALLEIKAVNEDARTIDGIATTNTTDRMDDIVEPAGAVYKLPLPLLWQHDSSQPIGWVEDAKATKNGIRIKARLAEAGVLAEVDRAWTMIKSGLVRGLSIGFKPIESEEIDAESWGRRFTSWEWLELSAVTIPANQEATITAVKHAAQLPATVALDEKLAGKGSARITQSSPGVAGNTKRNSLKGKSMKPKSIAERISAFEAKRAATVAAMSELMDQDGDITTLGDEQQQEYDGYDAEVSQIDGELRRLKRLESVQLESAQRVQAPAPDDSQAVAQQGAQVPARQITVRHNLPKGIGFARFAMAMYRAQGNHVAAMDVVKREQSWKDMQGALLDLCQKAAVPAADTTTSGWASQLAYASDLAAEFIEYLRPRTIVGQITNWRAIPFNVRMGSLTGGLTGYWVGQGKPIPMSKGTTSSTSLGVTKVAAIAAVDEELMRLSSPSAEQLVRDELAAASVAIIDTSLIDPNQGGTANIQPASLTYGVTPVTATGTNYAALSADIQSMFDAIHDADVDPMGSVLVMTPQQALALSMMVTSLGVRQFNEISDTGGTIFGKQVVVSRYVGSITGSPDYGDMIVLIHPREVFMADDGQASIEVSREASLEMLDNPTNTSTGSTTATTMVSMFQTHSTALKAVRFVNWTKRRSVACQFIRNGLYR